MASERGDSKQHDLFAAAATGSIEEMHKLISEGADLDTPDEDGNTVTHIAAQHRHLPVIEALHDLGVDMNALNDKGWTPVYMAAASGHDDQTRFLKALADLGADVNIASTSGWSPLQIASQQRHGGSVLSLIEAGADVDMVNNYNLTHVYFSACLGHWDICSHLVNAGANIISLIGVPLAFPASISGILSPFQIDLSNGDDPNTVAKSQVFSTVKLMSSVSTDPLRVAISAPVSGGGDSSTAEPGEHDALEFELALVEAFHVVNSVSSHHGNAAIHHTNYTMRRWLSKCAWRVHSQSPLGRGTSLTRTSGDRGRQQLTAVARQYAQLVSLFADQTMLIDLLALRLTCQSNNYRQRFPVTCLRAYHELEVNLIESFVANDASRLVPTGLVNSLLTLFPVDDIIEEFRVDGQVNIDDEDV